MRCLRVGTVGILLSLIVVATGPVLAAEPLPDYRIGIDDVLAISVWDNKDVDQVIFVRPDGKISLPLAGEIDVRGMSVADLETRLSEVYQKTIKGALVTVIVKEIRSRPIFFIGGVGRVGSMQLTQDWTLLQAISAAGGLVPQANLEAAYVLRGDKVLRVDFQRLIQKADTTQNIRVQAGDTIVVPVADFVYVQGEVKAPGNLKHTNDLTMLKAIAQAGGLTNLAAGSRVVHVHGEAAKRENSKVNVEEMLKGTIPDIPLKPNDIVIVPQRLF